MVTQELALDDSGDIRNVRDVASLARTDATLKDELSGIPWICPVCRAPMGIKFGNKGVIERGKESHYFHKPPYSVLTNHEPESELHRNAKAYFKEIIGSELERLLSEGTIVSYEWPRTEEVLCEWSARADVFFSCVGADGTEVLHAMEIQYSDISPGDFSRRHEEYRKHGILDTWIMGEDFAKFSASQFGSFGWVNLKSAIQPLIETFGHALAFKSESKELFVLLPAPKKRKVSSYVNPIPTDPSGYMYCGPDSVYKGNFKGWRVTLVPETDCPTLKRHIDDYRERDSDGAMKRPAHGTDFIMFRHTPPPFWFDLKTGAPLILKQLSELSAEAYQSEAKTITAFREDAEKERKKKEEMSKWVERAKSNHAELNVIYALCTLWSLSDLALGDLWNGDSKAYSNFMLAGDRCEDVLESILAVMLRLKQANFVMETNQNRGRQFFREFDTHLWWYVKLLEGCLRSDGIFWWNKPSFEAFLLWVRSAKAGRWMGKVREEERHIAIDRVFADYRLWMLMGTVDRDHYDLGRNGWFPFFVNGHLSWNNWLSDIYWLIISPDFKGRIRSHADVVKTIFRLPNTGRLSLEK